MPRDIMLHRTQLVFQIRNRTVKLTTRTCPANSIMTRIVRDQILTSQKGCGTTTFAQNAGVATKQKLPRPKKLVTTHHCKTHHASRIVYNSSFQSKQLFKKEVVIKNCIQARSLFTVMW